MKTSNLGTAAAKDNTSSLIGEALKTTNLDTAGPFQWLPKIQSCHNVTLLKLLGVDVQVTADGGVDASHRMPDTHAYCPAVLTFDPVKSLLQDPLAATYDMVVPVW
jgi:hypothetical protein